jgi:type III secretion system FlhB-like substrate exporter
MDTHVVTCNNCEHKMDWISDGTKPICEDCLEHFKKIGVSKIDINDLHQSLKNVILPEEVPKEEYDKVINYLITIGFFRYYLK